MVVWGQNWDHLVHICFVYTLLAVVEKSRQMWPAFIHDQHTVGMLMSHSGCQMINLLKPKEHFPDVDHKFV